MTTNEKIDTVIQTIKAMGLIDTTGEKINLIKGLAEKFGLKGTDIFSDLPSQPQSASVSDFHRPPDGYPEGFETCYNPAHTVGHARYNGEVIGVIFQLNGRHFVFSHKDKYTNVSPQKIKKYLDKLQTIGGQKWRIPTIAEFEEVQRSHSQFNKMMLDLGGKTLDNKEYMDTSTPYEHEVAHVRLAMSLPWLD